MKTVVAFENKKSLSDLLDLVEKGDEVTITRGGRPVARLVASGAAAGSDEARQAVDAIRIMSERYTLGGIPLSELIDDGRR